MVVYFKSQAKPNYFSWLGICKPFYQSNLCQLTDRLADWLTDQLTHPPTKQPKSYIGILNYVVVCLLAYGYPSVFLTVFLSFLFFATTENYVSHALLKMSLTLYFSSFAVC